MLSFVECAPNRPPRWQKFPLASGTEKFEPPIGFPAPLAPPHHPLCPLSCLLLGFRPPMIIPMARSLLSFSVENSEPGIFNIGTTLCPPTGKAHLSTQIKC